MYLAHQGILPDIGQKNVPNITMLYDKQKINSDILKYNYIAQTFAENDPSKFWQDIHKLNG